MSRSQIYNLGKSELQKIIDESNSYADVLRKLGMTPHGNNNETLKKVIIELNIDLTRLNENRQQIHTESLKGVKKGGKKPIPLEKIISGEYTKDYQSDKLKQRLIQEGIKERKCEMCGNTEWMGNPIPLQLHHKDGNHSNNKLDNLMLLCPNCHSLTDTFAGKNIKSPIEKKIENKKEKYMYKGLLGWDENHEIYISPTGFKDLCPICNSNLKRITASCCKACANRTHPATVRPTVTKEEFYSLLDQFHKYTKLAEILHKDRKTIKRWHEYFIKEDAEKGIIHIKSEIAPSREILKEKIRTIPFSTIGKEYGVDGNAVKKWCIKYNLPHLKKEIKNISDEDWVTI